MSLSTAPTSRPNDSRISRGLPRRARRAFTFTEVMFAVVILGIGFIMIAAIFPVAIRQTAQSAEESVAITAAERGVAMIQSRATKVMFPETARPVTTGAPPFLEYHPPFVALGEAYNSPGGKVVGNDVAAQQWVSVAGDLISTTDARLGFALAYARSGDLIYSTAPVTVIQPGNNMRVITVVAQSRDRPRFNENDATTNVNRDLRMPRSSTPGVTEWQTQYTDDRDSTATLQFKRLRARFLVGQNGAPDQIQFTDDGSNMTTGGPSALNGAAAVAPGTFVIVADSGNGDPTTVKIAAGNTAAPNARANGRVFRIGNPVTSPRGVVFELVPGQDLTSIPLRSVSDASGMDRPPYFTGSFGTSTNSIVEVLVLGRSLRDPTIPFNASSNPYVGLPLDIAVYTTTVGLRQ